MDNKKQNYVIGVQAHNIVKNEGIFAQYDFFDTVEEYFNLPIKEALKSNNMVIKILSLIDRRVGKRTLRVLTESIQNEREVVQYFYKLCCKADNIN